MHIPDNYLSPATCAVMGAAMIPVWAVAVRNVKKELSREKLPMLGIGAAFSFLLMMFNIPLPGGTTGHAVGGTLLAILIGPFSACLSVTVTLFLQAFLFGDGGILSFGANCFNMAFVLPVFGYYAYRLLKRPLKSAAGDYAAVAIASYAALNLAALLTAFEFGIQPLLFQNAAGQPLYNPYPLSVSVPAMMIPHLLVAGVVEALFTVAILAFIRKRAPGILHEGEAQKSKAVYGLIAVLAGLSPLGLLAAGTAWGEWDILEIPDTASGGGTLGYLPEGMKNGFRFESLLPDYTVGGMPEIAGYLVSAVAGVSLLLILFKLISHMINRNS